MIRMRSLGVVVVLGLLAACSAPPRESVRTEAPGSLSSALSSSAARTGVPRDLLVALGQVEGALDLPAQRLTIDVDSEVPAAGPLQLRRGKLDTLKRGAELVGATEIELRRDGDLALEAGARVLAELGAKTGARSGDLASWSTAVAEMSGFADEAHREHYVHQVFATLARGGRFEGRDGEVVVLAPHDLPPSLTIDVSDKLRTLAGQAEYPDTQWFPTSCSGKCAPGRPGKIDTIIIHDTEGSWNASVATLQNDPGKSAHYIIDTDGRLGQFITEDTTGWHCGNSVYNGRSIGIEHVGYKTKPFPEAQYVASAKLVEHLTTKYSITKDRVHIIGHDQVPNGNKIAKDSPPCGDSPTKCNTGPYGGANGHTDPGVWEWSTYMARFGGSAKCNDAPTSWTCSADKTKAFRCAGTSFELQTCDGPGACAQAEGGAEATCNVAPKTTPPEPVDEEEPAKPPTTTRSPEPPEPEPLPAADEGCTIVRGGSGAPSLFGAGLVAAVALVRSLRLRRRR